MTNNLHLPLPTAEDIAQIFHAYYEELAPLLAYETRPDSRKTHFGEVPERNRVLMIATALRVRNWIEQYLTANFQRGELLHRDTIPLLQIAAVVDDYRLAQKLHQEPQDQGLRMETVIDWLMSVAAWKPALPYAPIEGAEAPTPKQAT